MKRKITLLLAVLFSLSVLLSVPSCKEKDTPTEDADDDEDEDDNENSESDNSESESASDNDTPAQSDSVASGEASSPSEDENSAQDVTANPMQPEETEPQTTTADITEIPSQSSAPSPSEPEPEPAASTEPEPDIEPEPEPEVQPSKDSTVEELENAAKKCEDLDYLHTEITTDVVLNGVPILGSLEVPLNVVSKVNRTDRDNPISDTVVTAELPALLGGKIQSRTYIEDGWTYVDGEETYKYKSESSSETLNALSMGDFSTYFEGKEFIENKDGSRSVSAIIPGEELSELLGAVLEETLLALDAEAADADVTVTLKDGYIISMSFKTAVKAEYSGMNVDVSIDVNVEYKDIGKPVQITPPADYKKFEDKTDIYGSAGLEGKISI